MPEALQNHLLIKSDRLDNETGVLVNTLDHIVERFVRTRLGKFCQELSVENPLTLSI